MDKLATNLARRSTPSPANRLAVASTRGRRRSTTRGGAKASPQLTLTRLTASVELTPPVGCMATVLLKEHARDEKHRYYMWWIVVGRNGEDAFSVHYKHNGEDTIRCDIPEGSVMSTAVLQSALRAFWSKQDLEPDGTPIIGGGGTGGTGK